jgi:hypothetical protein
MTDGAAQYPPPPPPPDPAAAEDQSLSLDVAVCVTPPPAAQPVMMTAHITAMTNRMSCLALIWATSQLPLIEDR